MEKFGKECKELMVEEIKEKLKSSGGLFISSFKITPVSEQEQLRRKLKEFGASFFVVKNRIAKQAFDQLDVKALNPLMQGLTALTLGGGDLVCVSKALVDFAKKHEGFKVLGAYVDKQLLDLSSINRLASIPSKEALFAQIVYGFKSPIQGLVNSLSGTIRNFIVVISKIQEKVKERG